MAALLTTIIFLCIIIALLSRKRNPKVPDNTSAARNRTALTITALLPLPALVLLPAIGEDLTNVALLIYLAITAVSLWCSMLLGRHIHRAFRILALINAIFVMLATLFIIAYAEEYSGQVQPRNF